MRNMIGCIAAVALFCPISADAAELGMPTRHHQVAIRHGYHAIRYSGLYDAYCGGPYVGGGWNGGTYYGGPWMDLRCFGGPLY
jgi:uncharacterized membrane protein